MNPDYPSVCINMYAKMFNTLTDVDRKLEQLRNIIQSAQAECEEAFLRLGDPIVDDPQNRHIQKTDPFITTL